MENLKGLELLFLLTRDQFTCKEDSLVAVFHSIMINEGEKCIGIGDEWTERSDGSSEVLPAGWNSGQGVYSLRYVTDSSPCRYLLKIVKAGQSLLVNALDVDGKKAAGMSIIVDNHASGNYEEFSKAYINLAEVSRSFKKVVLNQLPNHSSGSSDVRTQKSSDKTDHPLQTEKVRDPGFNPRIPEAVRPIERGFPSIGRGDLDPFAGGVGGGMLVDPSSFRSPPRYGIPDLGGSHGIPRGSVPPGARFDPLGPIGAGRGFSRPDPDHLPPPGYDDMFM